MTIEQALSLTTKITAFSVAIQSAELLARREMFSADGVWSWKILGLEFAKCPRFVRVGLGALFAGGPFLALVSLRFVAALALLFFASPVILAFLFISTLLTSFRWRGSFNGGSDSMTLLVLLGLSLAYSGLSIAWLPRACVWYIAVQCGLSYFIAGLVKVKNADWRTGRALAEFLRLPAYEVPAWLSGRGQGPLTSTAAWAALVFECSFPLALASPLFCLSYLVCGIFFHAAVAYTFGLNRFLYAWAAAYPALYYCSQHLLS